MKNNLQNILQHSLIFSWLCVVGFPAFADEPSFDSEPQFGVEPDTNITPQPKHVLPPLELPSSADNPVINPRVRLNTVVLRGNTVLSEAEVKAVVQPFLQRDLSPEDLQALRRKFTLLYVNQGYINSGVILPNQTVENGKIVFHAVEGQLAEVLLNEESTLDENYITREIEKEIHRPLSLNDLQTGIRRLELNPLIRKVEGRLLPGAKPGDARLDLKVHENHPFSVIASLDNHESPTVGSEHVGLTLEHLNLTGHRDELHLSLSATEELRNAHLGYRIPLWEDRLDFGVYYKRGTSEVVERPFDGLDITGDTESYGLSLDYHIIDRLDRRVTLLSGLDYASSETELLGRPFSFSLGARQGESVSTSVRLGIEWVERWDNQLLALRTSVRRGIDWLDSTMIPSGAPTKQFDTGAEIPDSRYTIILTQAQWANRLDFLNSQIVVNASWQEALDPLLSVDRFAIGGNNTVRGFRENALLRDNGIYANLEWRVPFLRNNPRWSKWNWTVIPFFDYGRSWDEDKNLSTNSAPTLTSVGVGLTATPFKGAHMELFYGEQLENDDYVPGQENNLQDEGIHFSFSYRWSPG